MKFIDLLKKIVIDPITVILGCMFLLLGFNYYSKFLTQPKKNNNVKPLIVIKTNQVCTDSDNLIECFPLEDELYKIFLVKNEQNDSYTIVISDK